MMRSVNWVCLLWKTSGVQAMPMYDLASPLPMRKLPWPDLLQAVQIARWDVGRARRAGGQVAPAASSSVFSSSDNMVFATLVISFMSEISPIYKARESTFKI